jgi:DNA invertase Pin-like site-specific DNA recombinase
MKVGYARVSTGEQNLEMQTNALEEAGCEKIFTDEVSGAKSDRPGLQDALEYLREGDSLVVWRLDRLGRSLNDLVEKVDGLRDEGKEFQSLQESIDTTSANGRFQFHIFSALAEFERNLIRERTMAGLRAARARGNTGGRPPALSNDEIERAANLIGEAGWSVSRVAELFEVHRSTIYRYISPNGDIRKKPKVASEN